MVARVKYERNKQLFFKNFVPLSDCISELAKAQVDIAKDLAVLVPMHI